MSYPALAPCASPRLHPGSQAPGGWDRPCLWSASSLQPDLTPSVIGCPNPACRESTCRERIFHTCSCPGACRAMWRTCHLSSEVGLLRVTVTVKVHQTPCHTCRHFSFSISSGGGDESDPSSHVIPRCCPMMKRCALTEFPVRIQHNH